MKGLPPHPAIKILLVNSDIENPVDIAEWISPLLDRYGTVDGIVEEAEAHGAWDWVEVVKLVNKLRSARKVGTVASV